MSCKTKFLRLGELFCGPGGLALGALQARSNSNQTILRIAHQWANDIDNSACQTYRRNIATGEQSSVICADVHDIDITSLDEIDIFAYGFPCNDFSIVGKHKGIEGKHGGLYKTGIHVLNHFNPLSFVAENVGGINSADDGLTFERILNDLQKAGKGYNLSVHLYKAEDYGVPQTRHRYIIVGFRRESGLHFEVPAPTHINDHVPVSAILEDVPPDLPNNELTRMSSHVIERLRHIKPGENAWTANLPEHLRLNVKGAKLSQIYRRLEADRPSYTITGSGGGGTHGYHYREPRALTNRERARIQTFPDDFIFCGSKEQVRKQIGMAVPPRLSRVIFQAILDTINGISYKSISANYQLKVNRQLSLF